MVELTDEQFDVARQRGDARLQGPRAVAARYDARRGRVVITLTSGVELGLAPRDVEGLAGASAEDLRVAEMDTLGLGIHFPRLDADLYVPALLGETSGKVRSAVKSAAARENGRRGGRPRKSVSED